MLSKSCDTVAVFHLCCRPWARQFAARLTKLKRQQLKLSSEGVTVKKKNDSGKTVSVCGAECVAALIQTVTVTLGQWFCAGTQGQVANG